MTTNIETAVGEIKQYVNRELQLLNQKAEKQIELEIAERSGGDALLDGAADDSIERAVRLQLELRQIDLALTSCRARRLQAVQQKHDAEIQEFRQRAAAARQQADGIQAATAPLLEQLKALENVNHLPDGQSESARLTSLAHMLTIKADESQRKGIATTGNIQIDGALTPESIARTVLEFPADCPTAERILAWVASHDQRAQFATHRLNVYLIWTGGEIDRSAYVQILEPLQPPVASPVEEAMPTGGRLVRVDQFFGVAARPRRDQREEEQSA